MKDTLKISGKRSHKHTKRLWLGFAPVAWTLVAPEEQTHISVTEANAQTRASQEVLLPLFYSIHCYIFQTPSIERFSSIIETFNSPFFIFDKPVVGVLKWFVHFTDGVLNLNLIPNAKKKIINTAADKNYVILSAVHNIDMVPHKTSPSIPIS